jgi:hypothetical protein
MPLSPEQLQTDRDVRLADWDGVLFQPAVEREGEVYELPRPVWNLLIKDTWDSERFKTLLVDGDTVVGSTRNGVEISFMGEIGSASGGAVMTPAELFSDLIELRTQLHVGADDAKFRFYLYRDEASGTYRYFESCTTAKLETELSNLAAFKYRLWIHADDPTIYS